MRRGLSIVVVMGGMLCGAMAATHGGKMDMRMKGAYRRPAVNGWTQLHLEGTPSQIGFQHGALLASEIADLQKVFALELSHDTGKDWKFFRDAAQNMMWPHIETEYREEMQGIAEGLKSQGVELDLWDVVAMDGSQGWS